MPRPRHIVHGGAGNITLRNLPPSLYIQHASFLLSVNRTVGTMLDSGASALDAATEAVCQMEDCEWWNCGKGAVFTRSGNIELEASVGHFRLLRLFHGEQEVPEDQVCQREEW